MSVSIWKHKFLYETDLFICKLYFVSNIYSLVSKSIVKFLSLQFIIIEFPSLIRKLNTKVLNICLISFVFQTISIHVFVSLFSSSKILFSEVSEQYSTAVQCLICLSLLFGHFRRSNSVGECWNYRWLGCDHSHPSLCSALF